MEVIRSVIVMSLMSVVAYGFLIAHNDTAKTSADSTLIQEEGVIVVVSSDRKCISTFSIERSRWSQLKLDAELTPEATPILYNGLVTLKNRGYVYGYSAKMGAWDRLKVEDEGVSEPVVGTDCIHLKTKEALYVFGINSVYWTAVNLTTGDTLQIGKAADVPTKSVE